jgi:hypothetical protein
MQVGDLVKVYDFSHTARRKFVAIHRSDSKWTPERIDAHYVGLIVASSDPDPKCRRVLRCVDGEWEDYHVNRLEVIA